MSDKAGAGGSAGDEGGAEGSAGFTESSVLVFVVWVLLEFVVWSAGSVVGVGEVDVAGDVDGGVEFMFDGVVLEGESPVVVDNDGEVDDDVVVVVVVVVVEESILGGKNALKCVSSCLAICSGSISLQGHVIIA